MAIGGRGRLQCDDEVELQQFPRELHPGCHEAREGQGHARGGLRAHAGRYSYVVQLKQFLNWFI